MWKRSGKSRAVLAKHSGPKGLTGANPVPSDINWYRVIFIGLVWFFIVNAGSCHLIYRYLYPQVCNPRVIESCEP